MTSSLEHQRGFGVHYLLPVIAVFAICINILIPSMQTLFAEKTMLIAIGLCLIPIAGSVWLASQCFADYLSLGIVIAFALVWSFGGAWILDFITAMNIDVLRNQAVLSITVLSLYIYIHAIILSIMNLLQKNRDSSN